MGFFNRFFKKVEQVNNHEATLSELNEELYVESPIEEANSYWVSIAQNIIINAVKAADNNVERAFVLLNLKKSEASFDIFYQINGQLYFWDQLENENIKNRIQNELLPQASEVSNAVNQQFNEAEHPAISFAELQFEWETKAWFSHIIWEDDPAAQLPKTQMLNEWFNLIKKETKNKPLDSDTKFSWYPSNS
ncbi:MULTISPECIES: hypothetical protein [Bacillus]|uniref:Uncharacterized protein n=1 Tax=Bacillus mycoides TaxID=1405 RepID=A0A1S9TA64_BACMY|nr:MULTISPECIES: hypothetical protein [Bacillus]EJS09832.1 hypothetical protein IKO_01220 [Bacillus cereus VDM034]EJS12959.1 hypothetical protein IKS_03956 [Bacillus cereus VDM062]MBG9686027.1 hypothetical protein [Bacillus mycoides]MED1059611.1 hypothetical protein [Bacillus mycoides]OOR06925.1 hypothetical protein BW900_09730 [Bacillus mycoides]